MRQTGGWGRGLGTQTLCALCSPSLCLFLYSRLILISNTCTQHLESVRYHLEASGSFRRAPDHALRGPVRGTHAGYMRGTSVAGAGPSIPVGFMGAGGRVLSNSDPRTTSTCCLVCSEEHPAEGQHMGSQWWPPRDHRSCSPWLRWWPQAVRPAQGPQWATWSHWQTFRC